MSAVKVMLWMFVCIHLILTAKAQDTMTDSDQNYSSPKQVRFFSFSSLYQEHSAGKSVICLLFII